MKDLSAFDIAKFTQIETTHFAVSFTLAFKDKPALRRKILDSLPNDGSVQKEKVDLLLLYDEGELNKAFEIVSTSG